MNRILLTGLVLFLSWGTVAAQILGEGLKVQNRTPVSELIDHPDSYLGKRVQVEGVIVEVCEMRGCWIYLSSDRPYEKIRVKVKDGEIVFPLEARGKNAVVEGILEKLELSREEVIARRQHHADEKGERFDPSTVTEGETVYRLRGLAAEIPGI